MTTMCTAAWIKRVGSSDLAFAGTRGDLRRTLGIEPVYADDSSLPGSDRDCLCGCDMHSTAKLAGATLGWDEMGNFELTLGGCVAHTPGLSIEREGATQGWSAIDGASKR